MLEPLKQGRTYLNLLGDKRREPMQIRCIKCNKVLAASIFPAEKNLLVVDSSKEKDEKGIEVKCRYCKTFNLIVV